MDIEIRFEPPFPDDAGFHIQNLATKISRECDTSVQLVSLPSPNGTKDPALLVGLSIASLALTAIDTIINILSYWQSMQTKYSAKIVFGTEEYTIEANSIKNVNKALSKIKNEHRPNIKILIASK